MLKKISWCNNKINLLVSSLRLISASTLEHTSQASLGITTCNVLIVTPDLLNLLPLTRLTAEKGGCHYIELKK